MKLQEQVVSLKLSKELKENDYLQKGLFFWCETIRKNTQILEKVLLFAGHHRMDKEKHFNRGFWMQSLFVAPTVAELGERLPKRVNVRMLIGAGNKKIQEEIVKCRITMYKSSNKYVIGYGNAEEPYGDGNGKWFYGEDNEAIARAKMWLYLKKNNLLEVNENELRLQC